MTTEPGAGPAGPTGPLAGLTDEVTRLLAGPRPLPIVQAGHPVLRTPAAPYRASSLAPGLLADLLAAMHEAMRAAPGVGLAAPQVGLGLAIAVVEDPCPVDEATAEVRERVPVPFRVLVNPRYEPVGDERVAFYEGCLSVTGLQAVRARWRSVRLTGWDEHGRPVDEVLHGWPARIVQHETDHLNGTLYLDEAEMRSLVAPGEALRWAGDPTPHRAARTLGFALP